MMHRWILPFGFLLAVFWSGPLYPQDFRPAPMEEGGGIQIRISVMGEVKQPGTYWIKDGATLLDALATAGGPTQLANIKAIQISRPSQRTFVTVNLERVLTGKDTLSALEPGDVILVPTIATVRWQRIIGILRDFSLAVVSAVNLWQLFNTTQGSP